MKTRYIILAALAAVLAGCAKEDNMTTGEAAKAYLELWINEYYPGATANSDGIYILEDEPGDGTAWSSASTYAYISYTIRSLDGTVSSTTDENVAKQLGTYAVGNYYGPRYSTTGEGSSYAGQDAILSGMREGGTRKAIVPSWMLTTSRYSTQQEYLDNATSTSSLIYTVTLKGQSEDMEMTELDSLTRYVARHYPGAVSVSYDSETAADGTFYFISDTSEFEDEDSDDDDDEDDVLGTGDEGTINYTGRLLNGQVFDTTIEKVAKDSGIYSSSKTYTTQTVTFADSYSDITMGESSSLIDGFKGGLSLMKYEGQKATVIFTSAHGYTSSGSGSTIPGWSPLIFEIELVSLSSLD